MSIPSFLIFARYPEHGTVKTRLIPLLGAELTTALYRAMMLDFIERVAVRGYHTVVYVSPPERITAFQHILPNTVELLPQRGETLGDRMLNAFTDAHERAWLPALLTGTDSPTIPDTIIESAMNALHSGAEAVLGPADDGGFYALGLREVYGGCFFGNDYSNSTVWARTWRALSERYTPIALPMWYDIDDTEGLTRLAADPELLKLAPRTASILPQVLPILTAHRQPGD